MATYRFLIQNPNAVGMTDIITPYFNARYESLQQTHINLTTY